MATGTIIIILLLIILVIAAVSVIGTNKSNLKKIEQLQRMRASLTNPAIDEEIKRLEKMELAGKSLETFNKWKKKYDRVENIDRASLDKLLKEAKIENGKYSLFKANNLIHKAQELVQTAHEDLKGSEKTFGELLESNRDNQKQNAALLKSYQTLRKEVLAKSYNYEVALDKIEDELSSIGKDFDSVKNLSAQGDHVEAKQVLQKIDEKLGVLSDELPKVKQFDKDLKTTFPDQLDEISTTYKQMRKDKFMIKEVSVPEEVKNLYNQIDHNLDVLGNLDIDAVEKNNEMIASQIDNLYNILTKEFKAKPFIEKNQDKIVELLGHSATASAKLVKKLEHIDESYELTHGELQEAKTLESEVNHLNVDFGTDSQKLADGEGVYSEIENKWLALLKKLEQIEKRENEISQDVDGLYGAEQIANDSIDKFKQEVSVVYRRLERRHLPGKPESFIQLYTLVVNEIKKTSEELQKVRINMEHISEQLIQIQEDIDRLKKEAETIFSAADMVELMMQYSNKYLNDPEIKKARKETFDLYQNKYEYQEALDVIGTALEKVEPGAFERIENEYYADQKEKKENNEDFDEE